MSILVDFEIRREISSGKLIIDPFSGEQIQPSSYDLRLGEHFSWWDKKYVDDGHCDIDPFDQSSIQQSGMHTVQTKEVTIRPGEFMLAATLERIQLPRDLVGQLGGKSSLARLGLMVHATAGYIDPGFSNPPATITLELCNLGPRPIILTAGMPIAQLIFTRTNPCEVSYSERKGARYNGQQPAAPSLYYLGRKT